MKRQFQCKSCGIIVKISSVNLEYEIREYYDNENLELCEECKLALKNRKR